MRKWNGLYQTNKYSEEELALWEFKEMGIDLGLFIREEQITTGLNHLFFTDAFDRVNLKCNIGICFHPRYLLYNICAPRFVIGNNLLKLERIIYLFDDETKDYFLFNIDLFSK